MVDSTVPHDTESRLRNIEAHLGIGSVDPDTGEYTVKQYEESPGRPTDEEPDVDEEGV